MRSAIRIEVAVWVCVEQVRVDAPQQCDGFVLERRDVVAGVEVFLELGQDETGPDEVGEVDVEIREGTRIVVTALVDPFAGLMTGALLKFGLPLIGLGL